MATTQPTIQNQLLAKLLNEGTSTAPVQHWAQGLARVMQGMYGGYLEGRERQQGREAVAEDLRNWQGGQPAPQQHPLGPVEAGPRPATAPPARVPPRENVGGTPVYSQNEVNPMDVAGAGYGNAVASIESGGRHNLMGPVTRTGDRAYGKHQVMGNNVPSWTQAATGTAATPQQFLANPGMQEDTFNNKFAEYINRHGSPEAASRAWFAGERGMNNPNARDQLGTSVANYGQRFAQAASVPAQGGAPQGAPQQQPQAPPRPQIPPEIMRELNSPNPRVQQGAYADFQKWKEQQLKTDPTYGVIRKTRDAHGQENEVYGWRDPRTGALTETPSGAPSGQGQTDFLPADHARVSAFRKEITDLPSYKNLSQSAPVYKSMVDAAARDNRASDVNLIYGMAKLMDPGSVVRESEMSVAQAIATLPQGLAAQIRSQFQATGRLDPQVREALMVEAHSRVNAYKAMFDQDTTMARGIAQDARMNPRHVIPDFGEFKPFRAPAPAAPPAAAPQGGPVPYQQYFGAGR